MRINYIVVFNFALVFFGGHSLFLVIVNSSEPSASKLSLLYTHAVAKVFVRSLLHIIWSLIHVYVYNIPYFPTIYM